VCVCDTINRSETLGTVVSSLSSATNFARTTVLSLLPLRIVADPAG
jgi:hypothetical protein